MHCIDRLGRVTRATVAAAGVGLLSSCGQMPWSSTPPSAAAGTPANARARPDVATSRPAAAAPAHSWAELRVQAALRLVAANPSGTYTGTVEEPLFAVPVLEIELNADGSVHRINVLREPQENKDMVDVAIQAVRRAAPFGDVSRLPKPWRFTETFLFNDERKFKPRTLDQ